MTVKTQDKYGLREKAILVKVSTAMFGTQKKDREATQIAADTHRAAADQVAVVKSIINRKNPLFKKIDRVRGVLRNTHLATTGVWDDNFRIITTKKYAQWRETMDELVVKFDEAVADFVTALPQIKAEARENLGDLWDDDLIPDADKVRRSFYIDLETEVMPDRNNTILDLDQARTDQIIADANAADQKRIKALAEDTHNRVRNELEGMVEALRSFGDDLPDTKRTKTFRDSLIKRMAAMADTLPGLNVTGDPKLEKLAQDIAGQLTLISPADLRGDKVTGDNRTKAQIEAAAATKREETANAAQALVDDLDGIFGDAA